MKRDYKHHISYYANSTELKNCAYNYYLYNGMIEGIYKRFNFYWYLDQHLGECEFTQFKKGDWHGVRIVFFN